MSVLSTVARFLGCSVEHAGEALRHDEAGVKRVLSRRGALSSFGALVMAPLLPEPVLPYYSFARKPEPEAAIWITEFGDEFPEFLVSDKQTWGKYMGAVRMKKVLIGEAERMFGL